MITHVQMGITGFSDAAGERNNPVYSLKTLLRRYMGLSCCCSGGPLQNNVLPCGSVNGLSEERWKKKEISASRGEKSKVWKGVFFWSCSSFTTFSSVLQQSLSSSPEPHTQVLEA